MQNAYDIKELVSKFKAKGLDLTEDAAKLLIGSTFEWLKESAVISKTPYDDMASVVYPIIEKQIMEYADKIDGQVG